MTANEATTASGSNSAHGGVKEAAGSGASKASEPRVPKSDAPSPSARENHMARGRVPSQKAAGGGLQQRVGLKAADAARQRVGLRGLAANRPPRDERVVVFADDQE